MAGPTSRFREGDILYVLGDFDDVIKMVDDYSLELIDTHKIEGRDNALALSQVGGMQFSEIGIAEVVLMSSSKIINKRVKESNVRQLYNVNILGIRRRMNILQDVKDERMQSGDVLLVQHVERYRQAESRNIGMGGGWQAA